MKKSIIAAGAASVALAAMPIVGAFAANVTGQTDTLQINIGSVCSFGYNSEETPTPTIDVTGVAHANGDGSWGTDSTATAGTTTHPDTLSATMLNGTSSNNLGTTTLGVYCNNADGYEIGASGVAALTGATVSTNTIPINASFAANATGWSYQVAAATGGTQRGVVRGSHTNWASSSNANEVIAGSSTSSGVPKTTANSGDFFTITYGVGISDSLPADTYTGTITYTLNQL